MRSEVRKIVSGMVRKLSEIPGVERYVEVRGRDVGPDVHKVTYEQIEYFPVSVNGCTMDETQFSDGNPRRSDQYARISGYDYVRKRKFYFNTGSTTVYGKVRNVLNKMFMEDGNREPEFSCCFGRSTSSSGNQYYCVLKLEPWQIEAVESGVSEEEYVAMLESRGLIRRKGGA